MDKRKSDSLNDRLRDLVYSYAWRHAPADTSKRMRWYETYQQSLSQLFSDMDLTGVSDAGNQTVVSLAQIHVDERFTKKDLTGTEGQPDFEETLQKEPREDIFDLLITFDEELRPQGVSGRVVVIGPPGSGKTVLMRSLVVSCGDLRSNTLSNIQLGRRMVMPLVLRELDVQNLFTTHDLLDTYQKWLIRRLPGVKPDPTRQLAPLLSENLLYFLEKGWVIIAVDGMDEVGQEMRQRLHGIVYALMARFPKCAIVITGRPVGLRLEQEDFHSLPSAKTWKKILEQEKVSWDLPEPLERRFLSPFDDQQVEEYTKRWMAIRHSRDVEKQKTESETFLHALRENHGLRAIRRRPIFLALMTYIHGHRPLPKSQTLVYQEMVRSYLAVLDQKQRKDPSGTSFDDQDKWRILERLAWALHTKAIGTSGGDSDKTPFHLQIKRDEFEKKLEEWAASDMHYRPDQAKALVDYFLARTGLLVEPEKDVIQFSHLSFQEFLATSYLTRELKEQEYEERSEYVNQELLSRVQQEEWHPVGIHFFGIQSIEESKKYQERLLRDTWLETDSKITPTQWVFLHRLFSEGTHTLTDPVRQQLWKRFWQQAAQEENNNWGDALKIITNQWNVWPETVPTFMSETFRDLPSDEKAKWPLVLFSYFPRSWLETQWKNMGEAEVYKRWCTPREKLQNLFWALDCHGMFNEVGANIINNLSHRHYFLYNQLYPAPLSFLINRNHHERRLLLELFWNTKGLIASVLLVRSPLYLLMHIEYNLVLERAIKLELSQYSVSDRRIVLDHPRYDELLQTYISDSVLDRARAKNRSLVSNLDEWMGMNPSIDLNLAIRLDSAVLERKITLVQVLCWLMERDFLTCLTIEEYTLLLEIFLLWSQSVAYLVSCFNPIFNPKQIVTAWETAAGNDKELAELFDEEWFPYRMLKELADEPFVAQPIEAASVHLFRFILFLLKEYQKDTADLPNDLNIKPGDHFRKFHNDDVVDNYLKNLRAAGWNQDDWPPKPIDWTEYLSKNT